MSILRRISTDSLHFYFLGSSGFNNAHTVDEYMSSQFTHDVRTRKLMEGGS
jgi:hypothetical protein